MSESEDDVMKACDDLKRRLYETIDNFVEERGGFIAGNVLFVLGEMLAESHCKNATDKYNIGPVIGTVTDQFVTELRRPENKQSAPVVDCQSP